MAVLQKVKINNEWVPVSGSNVSTGGGGGSIDPEILEDYAPILRDFSNDFNNDFTN